MKIEDCPVEFFCGENCIENNADKLCMGKKALIVTGRHSAKKSGALGDVTDALEKCSVDYEIFDEISENPLVSVCYEGGRAAIEAEVDFIIGIGGGSPMDAAKAIAAYAANPEIEGEDIFDYERLKAPLPLVLIPTTAGTGSEANSYSVLTLDNKLQKKTFNHNSYADRAFIDAKYTYSLNEDYTLSTALDAFCHCLESYMSPKATPESMRYSLEGAKAIWQIFEGGVGDLSEAQREALIYASTYGGAAIAVTGTGFPHPMGYNFTLDRGVAHGRACGLFTGEYINYCEMCEEGRKRISDFCAHIGCTSEDLKITIPALARLDLDARLLLSNQDVTDYTERVCAAANFKNCVYPTDKSDIIRMYSEMFEVESADEE